MALNIDMDVEALNNSNQSKSSMSYITKTNPTGVIKLEPNMTVVKEDTHENCEKIDKALLLSGMDAALGTSDIKTEVWSELSENPNGMAILNSDVDSKMTASQIDCALEQNSYCNRSSVIKSEPGKNIIGEDCNPSAVIKSEPGKNNIGEADQNTTLSSNGNKFPQGHEITNIKKMWNELWNEPIDVPAGLSKRQKKKYIRKVLWETTWKPLRRAKEKEKLKQKKLLARVNNETLGPSRKMLKLSTMAASNCKLRIVLDFSFDDLMSEKDLGKCLKQLNHCYCLNRRAANPLQLYVTNFCGAARDQLGRGVAYKNWDINFHEDRYLNIFKKEELVYLTSDSDNTLTHLDHSKVYIIGALVDHNRYKGKTLEIAKHQGINHAKLPISEFLQMNSRSVLTIDHVFEILVHTSGGVSWKESFLKVLPPRKKAVEKNKSIKL